VSASQGFFFPAFLLRVEQVVEDREATCACDAGVRLLVAVIDDADQLLGGDRVVSERIAQPLLGGLGVERERDGAVRVSRRRGGVRAEDVFRLAQHVAEQRRR
jgi:hypothetical protein